ncbi:MAG: MATE family efflux transporter [Clostridia bacterium]
MDICNLIINPQKAVKKFGTHGELPSSRQIVKATFAVAWYSIVEGLSSAIVSLIDMAMVGGVSSQAIAAIGLTNQPRFIFLAIFFAMNSAVIAIVARRVGEKEQLKANDCMMQAFSICLILSVALSIVGLIFAPTIMVWVGALSDTIVDSTKYFQIMMVTNIFVAMTQILNSAQRAIGKTSITLKTSIIANVVNIFFNYLLIGGNFGFPRLEVAGAGIATLIGYVAAFSVALLSVCKKNGYLKFHFKKLFHFDKDTMRVFSKLAVSAGFEQMFVRIGFLLFAMIVAKLGTDAFSAHQIGMSILTISFSIGDGLGIAVSALTGKSLGEKRPDLAIIYTKTCQRLGLYAAFIVSVCFVLFPTQIYGIFKAPPHIAEMGVFIMQTCAVITYFQIFQCTSSGALRGAGDVKFVAIIAFVSITLIRPTLGYLFCFTFDLGLFGIWLAVLADQFTRFLLSYLRFKTYKWLKIKI